MHILMTSLRNGSLEYYFNSPYEKVILYKSEICYSVLELFPFNNAICPVPNYVTGLRMYILFVSNEWKGSDLFLFHNVVLTLYTP